MITKHLKDVIKESLLEHSTLDNNEIEFLANDIYKAVLNWYHNAKKE